MLAGRGPARLLRALGAAKVKVLVGHVYCRDAVVPIVEGDTEYRYGLHAIPQQPTIELGDF